MLPVGGVRVPDPGTTFGACQLLDRPGDPDIARARLPLNASSVRSAATRVWPEADTAGRAVSGPRQPNRPARAGCQDWPIGTYGVTERAR